MNLNQVASELNFVGSTILSLKIDNNIVNLTNSINNISMALNITKIEEKLLENKKIELIGYVQLKLNITAKDQEDKAFKCKISLILEGCFNSLMEDKNKFEQMLYINGGTTLYSIARSQILNFSSNMFVNGKILIPLINMVEFMEESEKEKNPK